MHKPQDDTTIAECICVLRVERDRLIVARKRRFQLAIAPKQIAAFVIGWRKVRPDSDKPSVQFDRRFRIPLTDLNLSQ